MGYKIVEIKSVNPIKVNFETNKEWLQVDWVIESHNGSERKLEIITKDDYNKFLKRGIYEY